MKKIFLMLICCTLALASCVDTPIGEAKMHTTSNNVYLDINGRDYYQIKIGNHTCYQYQFSTYTGRGSDIIHFEDMCEYCSSKTKKTEE